MGTSPLSILSPSHHNTDQQDSSSSSALLPPHESQNPNFTTTQRKTLIPFTLLLITTIISLSAATAFAFLYFSSNSSTQTPPSSILPPPPAAIRETSRPLQKLETPTVILISSDGFRFGYQFKTPTPNIHRLIFNGTSAEHGLIPVFPSLTFPNHYSIATGLFPPYHGIIDNHFSDPKTGAEFNMQSHEPEWWLGEPIWETVENAGKKAATYFWPGSEVVKGKWDCPEGYCQHYDGTVAFEDRVDTILKYFDMPTEQRPLFMTLYFEDPDHQGHQVGPDDPAITKAVARIDRMIGRLIEGLEKRGVFEDVSIILLGDHGMVGTCDKKLIFLDDFKQWLEIPPNWVQSYSPLLAIRPPAGVSPADVVAKMTEGLNSGKIENGEFLKVFLKEDLPARLHYSANERIPPIIGLIDEGYKVEQKKSKKQECGGAHGYDNEFFSMRTIFVAHGPQFARGKLVPSFVNVEIYNVMASILKVQGAPNNGTPGFVNTILLPDS